LTVTDRGRVGDHASRSFLLLTGSVADGTAELASSGKDYGVLVDPAGHARALLAAAKGAAPAVIIDANTAMTRLLGADVAAFMSSGVPGLVVADDAVVVGVIGAVKVIDYIDEYSYRRDATSLGDVMLNGETPVDPLTLTCAICGTVNRVVFFIDGETQCSQGHPLSLTWD
jgi:hypothetical protein